MPHVFDYEKQDVYTDNLGQIHINYYPMRYANKINTSKPIISGTWVNYGTEGRSEENGVNCMMEMTSGEVLYSGHHMAGQLSCPPHSYNAGNYYNFPAASAKSLEPTTNSVCSKGWKLPDNNGKTSYSNFLINYGVDNDATESTKNDAAILNLPLSYLHSGAIFTESKFVGRGASGEYRMTTRRIIIGATGYNPIAATNASYGDSVRCVNR